MRLASSENWDPTYFEKMIYYELYKFEQKCFSVTEVEQVLSDDVFDVFSSSLLSFTPS